MECPRCKFQQPEELYCARCGVHIPSALNRRKRNTLAALSVTALVFVFLGAAATIWWFKDRSGSELHPPIAPEERQSIPRIQPAPPLPGPAGPQDKDSRQARFGRSSPSSKKAKAHERISPPEKESSPSAPSQPPSVQPTESDPEVQLRRWAAQEWVDRGKELQDDPQQEMEMYRKALELEPGYAPAHYHLGMLHWRKADRDTALEEFRKFWQAASLEERRSLPIPEEILSEEPGFPPTE